MRRDRLKAFPALYYGVSAVREGIKIKGVDDSSAHWASGDFEPVQQVFARGRRLARQHQSNLSELRDYVMFVGNQRTGHSLVGSLLDAHPNVMVAHEVNALKLHALRFPVDHIDALLYENSRSLAQAGRGESGYDYEVPGMFQGTHTTLQILGDKDARRDTSILLRTPKMLARLQRRLGARRLRVFHVVRDPFDTLSTIWGRPDRTWVERETPPPREMIDGFFALARACVAVHSEVDVCTISHEDLVADAGSVVETMCGYLDIDCADDYRNACASLVRPTVHNSRTAVPWDEATATYVSEQMAEFHFFSRYEVMQA